MNTPTKICSNCESNYQCAIQADNSAVIFCEEHQEPKTPKEYSPTSTPTIADGIKYFGLCSTCDFAADCTLKSKDSIILNCEHYQ